MKVLIVEDDKVLSLLLVKMVERLSLEIIGTATKGRDAISLASNLNPDLILMDIMLEDDIDGIEAIQAIKKINRDVPVIYITGNSDPHTKERARQTNYADYIIKPIYFDDLKNSIAALEK